MIFIKYLIWSLKWSFKTKFTLFLIGLTNEIHINLLKLIWDLFYVPWNKTINISSILLIIFFKIDYKLIIQTYIHMASWCSLEVDFHPSMDNCFTKSVWTWLSLRDPKNINYKTYKASNFCKWSSIIICCKISLRSQNIYFFIGP